VAPNFKPFKPRTRLQARSVAKPKTNQPKTANLKQPNPLPNSTQNNQTHLNPKQTTTKTTPNTPIQPDQTPNKNPTKPQTTGLATRFIPTNNLKHQTRCRPNPEQPMNSPNWNQEHQPESSRDQKEGHFPR
jgi:cytoskeletal protein RodZ